MKIVSERTMRHGLVLVVRSLDRPGRLARRVCDPIPELAAREVLAVLEPDHVPPRRADPLGQDFLAEADPTPGTTNPSAVLVERVLATLGGLVSHVTSYTSQ